MRSALGAAAAAWLLLAPGLTAAPASEGPGISDLAVEAGATSGVVTWHTPEPATSEVDYGTHHSFALRVARHALVQEHRLVLDRLAPGTAFQFRVTSIAADGTAASVEGAFNTATTGTFWLHVTGPTGDRTRWLDASDAPGDADGAGYNQLGAALATVEGLTGIAPPLYGSITDRYPIAPTHAALRLADNDEARATLFVKLVAGGMSVAGVQTPQVPGAPGVLDVRVALRAGEEVVASGARLVVDAPGGDRYFPVEVPLALHGDLVSASALSLEVRANASATGYRFGFEGDHASRVVVPFQAAAPLSSGLEAPAQVTAGWPARFRAWALGGAGGFTFAWSLDGTLAGSGITFAPVFSTPGEHHEVSLTVTDAAGASQTDVARFAVLQRDFAAGPRVVVALVDSGINPYHPDFARPGIALPPDLRNERRALPPRTIDLSDEGTYEERVAGDAAAWAGIGLNELVHFAGTNVLGVSIRSDQAPVRLRDASGHGTATASTVLRTFPDALLLEVQSTSPGGIGSAVRWATSQSWVDVIVLPWGSLANAPLPMASDIPDATRAALATGKLVVASAGNEPSPLWSDPIDGPPWVVSVSGSQAEGRAKEAASPLLYPDFVAPFTVEAARHDTAAPRTRVVHGTSFSAPAVAAVAAGALHAARGAGLAPSPQEVRAALNATALVLPWEGYVAGQHSLLDHAAPPGAEFLAMGWGEVDARVLPRAARALVEGRLGVPPEKALAAAYLGATQEARAAYWEHPPPSTDGLEQALEDLLTDLLGPPV